ncbi:MAG: ribonuclease HII [Nitrospirota bacterium]
MHEKSICPAALWCAPLENVEKDCSEDPFAYDASLRREGGFSFIAGVDEAGRGPLAGPVVAAAVILPIDVRIAGVRDSKRIPKREREQLFWNILDNAVDFGIGVVGAEEIDRINILQATRQAMHRAVLDLSHPSDLVLVDAVHIPAISLRQRALVKGDAKSASIAAASILAKVIRDRIMNRYHLIYPQYGFDRHKGYGTRAHLDKLREYGPCPIHRKSFQNVLPPALLFEEN